MNTKKCMKNAFYCQLLDVAFMMFVFSSIVLNASIIGKCLQLLFVILSVSIFFCKVRIPFPKYNSLLLLFALYVFFQVFFNIAKLEDVTSDMAVTVLYTSLFMIGMFNYIVYEKDLQHIVYLYVKASVFALCVIILLYAGTLGSFRLNANEIISIAGINFGGSSSTALATSAALPAFFISLFPPKQNRGRAFRYIIFLFLIALLTGTRKTLILFLFTIFYVNEQLKEGGRGFRGFKMCMTLLIGGFLMFLLIMNVPILYDMLGSRIESALLFFNSNDSNDDSSLIVRYRMIDAATELFEMRPLVGWGMDYFKGSDQSNLGYYSHNNFLELLSGGGLIGTVIYYSRYIVLLMLLYKQIKNRQQSSQQRIKWKSCLIFCIIMYVLEYWQVTYFYRHILIYQAIILAMVYLNQTYQYKPIILRKI